MMKGHGRIFLLVLGLLLGGFVHVCAASNMLPISHKKLQADDSTPVGPNGYDVIIFGVADATLEKFIRQNSILVKRRSNPPKNVLNLNQLAMDDLRHLQRALATQGYYDAELDRFVDTRRTPFKVYVKINLGPMYTVGAFKLKSDPPGNAQVSLLAESLESLGVTLGQPGKAEYLRKAVEKALMQLQVHGYPFAKLKSDGDRIVIDRLSKTIQAAFLISPGPLARFGETQMDNVVGVTPEFLKARLRWKKGDIYNEEKILETVESLYNTRLFKNIKVIHGDAVNPKTGLLDVYIRADSNPRNSVDGGASYATDNKHDVRIAWENRNMAGGGEILRLGGATGSYRKAFEASFVKPDMFLLNLELATRLTVVSNTMPAYYSKGFTVQSVAQYPVMQLMMAGAGLGLDMQRAGARTKLGEANYRYLSAPLMLSYETKGVNTFAKSGYKADLKITPEVRVFHQKIEVFDTMQLNQKAIVPIDPDGRLTMEPWLNIGMSPGSGKNVIPVHKRFYVGGVDSIRGYAYQTGGPLDAAGNPMGGRSSLTFGAELKYHLFEKLSVLGFIDVGSVFNNEFPDFSNSLMCGVGVGCRYETPLGTLRLDVGSPLHRRSKDSALQAYVGLDKKI